MRTSVSSARWLMISGRPIDARTDKIWLAPLRNMRPSVTISHAIVANGCVVATDRGGARRGPGGLMRGSIFAAAVLWLAGTVCGLGAESALKNIRISKDGAGPSHLFWLSGPSEVFPDRDVV